MSNRDLTPQTRGHGSGMVQSDHQPLHALQRRVEQVFDDFLSSFGMPPPARSADGVGNLIPRIDVSESDKAYSFTAELPGVDEAAVEVTLTNGALTIAGEKKTDSEEENKQQIRTERSFGRFQRSFSLPSDSDEDKVGATFKNGVLNITVGKSPETKKRHIEIHSA